MANPTIVGNLELTATFECISVYANFSGDDNENNLASFRWREVGGSWKQGMELTPDTRPQVYYDESLVDNPYVNQWRGSILGLIPDKEYEVEVTFEDPDGVSGINPVVGTIRTKSQDFLSPGSTYIVATNGSDSNPGTESQPWRTIQHAINNLLPGDRGMVKAGTYNEPLSFPISGEPNNYITLMSYDSGEVIVDAGNAESVIDLGVSYIRISGLHLRNAYNWGVHLFDAASHNVIEDCVIEDFGYANPDSGVGLHNGAAYNLVQNNLITSDRTGSSDAYHRSAGVSMTRSRSNYGSYKGTGEGNVIRFNTIYGVGLGDGVGGWLNERWTDGPYKDCDIYGNIIGPVNDDCVEPEGGDINVRIWDNTLIGDGRVAVADAPCIIGPLYFFRNIMFSNARGTTHRVNKVGNGVMDTGAVYYYHNSAYFVAGTAYGLSASGGNYFSNHKYRNNIIVTSCWVIDMPSASGNPEQNNTFNFDNLWLYNKYGDAGWSSEGYKGLRARWAGTRYDTIEDFRAGVGQELNGICADPMFYDPENGDVRLLEGSPCIDAGAILVGFNDLDSPWPYQGNAPDLGAIESGLVGPPVSSFSANPTSGEAPLDVQFTNESIGAIDSYLWDFGDGVTSSEKDPQHTYSQAGIYNVTLTVTGPGGEDSAYMDIEVIQTYSLELTAGEGGTTDPAPGTYLESGSVKLTALPDSDYHFIGWYEGGSLVSSENPVYVFMDSDRQIEAQFEYVEPPPGEYVVTITSLGQGTTDPIGEVTVTEGEELTITAYPDTGWKFDHWEGDIGGTQPSVVFPVLNNMSVIAVFKEKTSNAPVVFGTLAAAVIIGAVVRKRG